MNPKRIKALNLKGKTFQLKEDTREYLYDLQTGQVSFNKVKSTNNNGKYS